MTNILLILTDQHRLSAMGCYGDTPCRTPNLDRLAREGVLFETAYTACPVCSPARASVMTGLYPHQHGVCSNVHNLGNSVHELPDAPHLLPRRLGRLGVRCGYTGKWHLGTDKGSALGWPARPSLPRHVGFEGQNFPGHGSGGFEYPEYQANLKEHGYEHRIEPSEGMSNRAFCNGVRFGTLAGPAESTVPYFLTDHTLELIDRYRAAGEPFFVWHNFWGPHTPYVAPREYVDMYRNVEIPEWPNFRWEGAGANAPHQVKLHPGRGELTWDDWADAVRHYYAFATLIDDQVGRLMDRLRDTGALEDTLVIFAADHGETLGSHGGLTDKGWHHFEEIQRIPFIVRPPDGWTDIERGRVCHEWASLLDLYPTIVEAAGGQADAPSDNASDEFPRPAGRSLLPLVRGEAVAWREDMVVEFHGVNNLATSMLTLRQGRWKYGWNGSSWDELYDLEADPWETANLAADPSHSDTLHALRTRLDAWMQETRYPGRGMFVMSRLAGQASKR